MVTTPDAVENRHVDVGHDRVRACLGGAAQGPAPSTAVDTSKPERRSPRSSDARTSGVVIDHKHSWEAAPLSMGPILPEHQQRGWEAASDTTAHTRDMERFADRIDAGRQLARRLEDYRATNLVVLGLPRGGVPVGYQVAHALGAPLDVLIVRKLVFRGSRNWRSAPSARAGPLPTTS